MTMATFSTLTQCAYLSCSAKMTLNPSILYSMSNVLNVAAPTFLYKRTSEDQILVHQKVSCCKQSCFQILM